MDFINIAKEIIDREVNAIELLKEQLDDAFTETIELLESTQGKIVVTGVGKSGHIGRKIAATLSSLGSPAFFLHPDDAMHGDLGMVTQKDVVLAISNSGESDELIRILPNIRLIGAKIIAVTNNRESNLAKYSDCLCPIPKVDEACYMGLAPTSSTTVTLVLGDVIAIILSRLHSFKKENFGLYHPAGTLGKKLTTRVSDVMHQNRELAKVTSGCTVKEALFEISEKGLGATIVVDSDDKLLGYVTDGDIRRAIEKDLDIKKISVDDIMTEKPTTILSDVLAVEALMIMQEGGKRLSSLPVLDNANTVVGIITMSDILRLGIIY